MINQTKKKKQSKQYWDSMWSFDSFGKPMLMKKAKGDNLPEIFVDGPNVKESKG